jgi:hypothetical protein
VTQQQAEHTRSQPLFSARLNKAEIDPVAHRAAMRTAFVARFIVLREGRRSRAHRLIESLSWDDTTTADDLLRMFRQAFIDNGDKLGPVDRDLRRALEHARCSAGYFMNQYIGRATLSMAEALEDYQRSNRLLFGDEEEAVPRSGGWRVDCQR